MSGSPLILENVWLQQQKFEDANTLYVQLKSGALSVGKNSASSSGLASEIAQVREDIQKALNKGPVFTATSSGAGDAAVIFKRLEALEKENKDLRKITDDLRALILNVQSSIQSQGLQVTAQTQPAPACPAITAKNDDDDDDDDVDLFGSDDDEEEAKQIREKRLQEYAAKKAKKPGIIAKSSIVLDVKPWDDETNMGDMEKGVRSIEMDGLLWGASKLVEVGYGIKKLSIMCVVEDEKVSVDDLQEKIQDDFEDLVQSVDVAAFNKI